MQGIQYQASENNLFAFSYRKSIELYKYDIVNPFITYKSQYSYSQATLTSSRAYSTILNCPHS